MKAGAYRKYGRYVAQRLNRLEFVIIVILNLKMKRILLLVVLFLFATSCFAQSVKFSINAGLSESTFSEPFTPNGKAILVNGQTISKSFVTGYNVGGLVDFTIKRVSIQTGLVYTVIGGTNNDHFNVPGNSYPYIFSDKQTLNLNYLQVPLQCKLISTYLHRHVSKHTLGDGNDMSNCDIMATNHSHKSP